MTGRCVRLRTPLSDAEIGRRDRTPRSSEPSAQSRCLAPFAFGRPTRPPRDAVSAARQANVARGCASPPPQPARRGPSRRGAGCRGSRGVGARRPRTSGRRPSGRRDPRSACSRARSTETTMSPRWTARPGGPAKCAASPGRGRAALGLAFVRRKRLRREQRKGQHVGRTLVAQMRLVQRRELGVVRQDQPDRRRRGCPGGIERGRDGPGQRRRRDAPASVRLA